MIARSTTSWSYAPGQTGRLPLPHVYDDQAKSVSLRTEPPMSVQETGWYPVREHQGGLPGGVSGPEQDDYLPADGHQQVVNMLVRTADTLRSRAEVPKPLEEGTGMTSAEGSGAE